MRYKATVEYEGTSFIGWQRQRNSAGRSVQEAIEEAIKRFSQQTVEVFAAGRTDAGVHALGQVVHFDLKVSLEDYIIKNALNHYLRFDSVAILHLGRVDQEFHARFSAKRRHYEYRILNREAPPCLDRMRCWHVPKKLNVHDMQEASTYMCGKFDFASFRSKSCQSKSSIKTIDEVEVMADGEYVRVYVAAPSFLHNQVRIIVGTLVQCGSGLFSPSHIEQIIEKRNRAAAGVTAPAHGLYLTQVDY